MKVEEIPYQQTNFFSQFILDYISGAKSLKPFYNRTPELDSFKAQITEKQKQKVNRKNLVSSLSNQYAGLDTSSLVKHNIQLLADENTFTVATGHQLCLFTGPLYFIYKIISTLNLAESLKKNYPEFNFIPIYWMASEDNDFEEVNHVHLFGKKLTWNQNQKGGVGAIPTNTLAPLLEELKDVLGTSEEATDLYTLLSNTYLNNNDLASATRSLVNNLFSKYGLVILDSNATSLKREAISLIKTDVLKQENYPLIKQTNRQLPKAQAYVRPINFFYQIKGTRNRIEFIGKNYVIVNTALTFTKETLEIEIENHPERFSPNVLLRPLYKELILPNLAMIGGGAEVSYWMQLKSAFLANKIVFPILFLRNSALIIDAKSASKLNNLGISSQNLFEQEHALHKLYVSKNTERKISVADELFLTDKLFTKLIANTEDKSLQKSILSDKYKQINILKKIEQKLIKSEKQKYQVKLAQISQIKNKLFPSNTLQERYDNIIPFYLKYGADFIESLKSELEPFNSKFTIITKE